jgi:hypothetical protein
MRAYECAVAAEARRNKESSLLEYLDKMGRVEDNLPTDDDSLLIDHQIYSIDSLEKFDSIMASVLGETEVQTERRGLVERMENYLKDLKEKNFNASLEHCRTLFNNCFDTSAFRVEDFTNIDVKWQSSITAYREKAAGPCADYILAENVQLIMTHCGAVIRENNIKHESQREQVNRELQTATRQLIELKDLEILLRERLNEANSMISQQTEVKDRQVAELQANVNVRAQQAEAKVRDLSRENQSLKQELEQALKEQEMMVETQRGILDKRIAESESKLQRAQIENQKLERQLDEIREDHEKRLVEKNEQIGEISRKLKLIENQDDHPRQDNLLVVSLKEYLHEVLANFSTDLTIRSKNVGLIEQVSQLQSDINALRLSEQAQRLKLIEDYEEQIKQLRQELEQETRNSAQMMNSMVTQLQQEVTDLQTKAFTKTQKISTLIDRVSRIEQEKEALTKSKLQVQTQLDDQMEVIEALSRTIEAQKTEIEDKVEQICRLKFENVGNEDDNDILIQLMAAVLEFTKRQRGSVRNQLQAMHNADNKRKVEVLLERYRVTFT